MFKQFLKLSAMAAAANAIDTNATRSSAKDHWAVIVVGSSGYGNYRHQADGCHAYQIAKKNGIPEDQIILIMYDDVAHSLWNPYRGKLFNKPTPKGTPGVDVYEGCNVDYKFLHANKKTILGVLKGDTKVGKKVLKSNENSKVFFSYFDHGAPGLVGVPSGLSKYLYADELHSAIKYMHENKMYKEMTMYVEACESGSMFEKILEDNINVYALSAANAHESSWGTYCAPNDHVDGKSIKSCLGDLFSVNWMEDADKADMGVETLQNQYDTVKAETNKSHVLQWGQLSIADEVVGEFESGDYQTPSSLWAGLKEVGRNVVNGLGYPTAETQRKNDFAVDARDIDLHYLYRQVMEDPSIENQEALKGELSKRLRIDSLFKDVASKILDDIDNGALSTVPTDFDCYRDLIENFEKSCGEADTYTMKYFKVFAAQCDVAAKYPPAAQGFKAEIAEACAEAGMAPEMKDSNADIEITQ